MDVDTSLKILVIILSSTLAVFLILAIVLTVKIIKLVNHLEDLAQKAQAVAHKAEAIGDIFKSGSSAVAFGKLFANIHQAVFNRKGKGKE